MPVGFCCEEVKPPGPIQEKTEPLPLPKRLTVDPAQAGPLFVAFAKGTGPGGQMRRTVVPAVPVIEAVTVSVAVIDCDPVEVSVTLNVCVPLSPATKV